MTWAELYFKKINLAIADMGIFFKKESVEAIEVDKVKGNEIFVSDWK